MEPRVDLPAGTTADTVSLGDAPRPRPRLERGVCVGRYVILDWLGEGGMGVVYKAYDPELERAVALKLLNTTGDASGSPSSGRRERLLREAKALARLSHPNVLAVFDVGTFGADVFLATEFADGTTLGGWLAEEKRSRAETLRALLAAGEGLAAAHRAGLVHRDFKPANVIVGKDGRVRVLDFGLARSDSQGESPRPERSEMSALGPSIEGARGNELATGAATAVRVEAMADATGQRTAALRAGEETLPEAGTPAMSSAPPASLESPSLSSGISSVSTGSKGLLDMTITHFGQILGTPRFMAPEQHLGRPADARSDQFSFCVSAYEALYREFPFDGRGETYAVNVTQGRVRSAPAGSDVPRWLRALLLRGLSVVPADRFASMDELLEQLARDPMAARKRWASVAAAAVLLLGAGIGLRHSRAAPEPLCRGAERKLAGVWDDGRKRAVHAAFTGAVGAGAEDAFRRTEGALDEYARGWVAMHTEACEATRVRGEQSAELLDLRVECLGERMEELRAQVDVFARADASVVARAIPAARGLPRLETCADIAALRAPIRPPGDEQTRGRVDAVRTELAQARAQQRAGSYAGALTIATKASQEATTLAYRPVEAEALFTLSDVEDDQGDYAASERTLRSSVAAALAGRHEAQAARSLTALVAEVGLRQARFAEAHEWAALAQGECERSSDPFIKGELARNEARLFVREAKYVEARASIEKCLALWEPALGKDDDAVAGAVTDLGNVLLSLGKDEEALAQYTRSLAILEKAVGPDNPALAPDLNNLGDIYTGRGEYELAEKSLQRARALWERALGADHPKVALALYNLARVDEAQRAAEPELAKAERALAIWQAALPAEHPDIALGMHGVAEALRMTGDYPGALAKEEGALAIRLKVFGEKDADVSESLLSIGETHLAEGRPAAAVQPLDRALSTIEGDPADSMALAQTLFDLARAVAPSDRVRSRALATRARDGYARVSSPLGKARRGEVDAWLAKQN